MAEPGSAHYDRVPQISSLNRLSAAAAASILDNYGNVTETRKRFVGAASVPLIPVSRKVFDHGGSNVASLP